MSTLNEPLPVPTSPENTLHCCIMSKEQSWPAVPTWVPNTIPVSAPAAPCRMGPNGVDSVVNAFPRPVMPRTRFQRTAQCTVAPGPGGVKNRHAECDDVAKRP